MDSPPQTFTYMIAGYLTFAAVLAIYLICLFLRWRALWKRRRALSQQNNSNPDLPCDSEVSTFN